MNHREKRVSYAREIYYLACFVAVLAATGFSLWGPGGYFEMQRMQQGLDGRRTRMEDLRRSNADRLQNIQDLRSDRGALEKYARQKGYARPGDLIQLLPQKPPAAPAAPAPAKP